MPVLQFVYLGNVPGHRYDNTYCPSCHALLIERYGLDVTRMTIERWMLSAMWANKLPAYGVGDEEKP